MRGQDWAEIRRLRADDMPIAETAQVTGSPERGEAALASDYPR